MNYKSCGREEVDCTQHHGVPKSIEFNAETKHPITKQLPDSKCDPVFI